MVLGLFEGKLELFLEKTMYAPNEIVKGTVKLHLNSPKKARGIKVELYRLIRSGKRTDKDVFFQTYISNEREYVDGEMFQFQFQLPEGFREFSFSSVFGNNQVLSTVVDALAFFAPKPRWYVSASLDLPMSLDISSQVEIFLQKGENKKI